MVAVCRDCGSTKDNHPYLHLFDDASDPFILVKDKQSDEQRLLKTSKFDPIKFYKIEKIRGVHRIVS